MGLGINPAMPILELESWEAVARYLADYSTRLHRVGLLPSAKDLQVLVADSEESDRSVSYEQVDFSRPTVIIVGSEAHGVSPQAMQVVDSVRTIRIPMTRYYRVALAMYEYLLILLGVEENWTPSMRLLQLL